jgi:hypothetical protein
MLDEKIVKRGFPPIDERREGGARFRIRKMNAPVSRDDKRCRWCCWLATALSRHGPDRECAAERLPRYRVLMSPLDEATAIVGEHTFRRFDRMCAMLAIGFHVDEPASPGAAPHRRAARPTMTASANCVDPFVGGTRTLRMKKLKHPTKISLHKETIAVLNHLVLSEAVGGFFMPKKTAAANCFSKHPFGECF